MRDRGLNPVVTAERLRRRTDFRAAARGLRASGHGFVVQMRRREPGGGPDRETADRKADAPARVGFTVSKQVGNAVERNRVRRRLREVVRLSGAEALHPGHDYVLIGRRSALSLPFAEMRRELDAALNRVHAAERNATGTEPQTPLHEAGSPGRGRRRPPEAPRTRNEH